MVPISEHLIRRTLFETPAQSSGPPERRWLEETGMEAGAGGQGPPSKHSGHSLMLLLFHTPAAPHPVSLLAAETLTGPM